MRYLSLFTGCGLLDLGLERAGWLPVLFCEREMLGNGVQVQVGTLLGEALADLSRKVA